MKKHYLRVLDLFEKARRDHALLSDDAKVVVALSGGADSVGLLHILKRQERAHGIRVVAAHLDHGYHIKSRQQAEFCRDLCTRLSVPLYIKRIDLKTVASARKRSLEESARIERYSFFSQTCKKTGARYVATAHTLDDQAETVLMRLARGTGLRGLVAIPWKRKESDYTLIRPLLYCSKLDLVRWLRSEKIGFFEDPTNTDQTFSRNFVRHSLIPLMERKMNPQIKRALADYQSSFQDAFALIEEQAMRSATRCIRKRGRFIEVARPRVTDLNPAVLDEMLRIAISRLKGDFLNLGFQHVRDMRNLYLSKERIGKKLLLPGFLVVTGSKIGLRIAVHRSR